MIHKISSRTVALMLAVALLIPSTFFMMPHEAHALFGFTTVIGELSPTALWRTVNTAFNLVKDTITAISSIATEASTYALFIDKWVLEPIAFIESGRLLQAITAGVVQFVDGKVNGTGIPQFVQNLQGHLQDITDTQAFSFFSEFSSNSNSPFASSIVASLHSSYLQLTSLGGFFAANQCTLSAASPNINDFLAGNWSQGGAGAWFALTTQNQNNPFTLYQKGVSELMTLNASAVSTALNQLSWGKGMLSWCGAAQTPAASSSGHFCDAANICTYTTQAAANAASAAYAANNDSPQSSAQVLAPTAAANPTTDTCTQKNGTPGTIETPGSVISDALNKALGTTVDKLVQMGQVGPEINTILGSVATVMNTLSFGEQLLGAGNSGGLAGVAGPSSSGGSSALSQYQNQSGYMGVTNTNVLQGSASSGATADMSNRIAQYQTAWNAISAATAAASSSVAQLITACSAALPPVSATSTMQMPASASQTLFAAQSAQKLEIVPTAAQVAQAQATLTNAQGALQQIQADASSGATAAFVTDITALQSTPPTATDVATAQQLSAVVNGEAQANPSGSLNVSATSLVDQMNLISSNAAALLNTCTPVPAKSGSRSINYGSSGG